jgi:hypothetical protein
METSQAWWLKSVIPATQEAEIGKLFILGLPRQKVPKTLVNQ